MSFSFGHERSSRRSPAVPRAWATVLVLAFPLLSLVTDFGIGAAGFLFIATALCWWRASWQALRAHWPRTRWVLLAFLLNLAHLALLAFASRRSPNMLDGPARMCLIVGAMLVVQVGRPPLRALWLGAAGGALAAAVFIAWQRFGLGLGRPGGWLNPITFGDLALCLGLFALVGALTARTAAARWFAAAGVLAGAVASLLTGSRGGWVALPLIFLLLAVRRDLLPRRIALALPLLACMLMALAWTVPQTGVRGRVEEGANDIRLYLARNPVPTSIGVRLELWRTGLMLIREHPWTGQDTPAYKQRMHAWVAQGRISPAVFAPPEPPHLHNDVMQVLVTRGIPGLLAWIGILAAPLCFFWAQLGRARKHGPQWAAALAGLLLVLAYAGFGLSEVIFWSMKGNVFYAVMVFLLMGWCLNAEDAGAPEADAAAARVRPEMAPSGSASRR
jgi:O-antigen ligase